MLTCGLPFKRTQQMNDLWHHPGYEPRQRPPTWPGLKTERWHNPGRNAIYDRQSIWSYWLVAIFAIPYLLIPAVLFYDTPIYLWPALISAIVGTGLFLIGMLTDESWSKGAIWIGASLFLMALGWGHNYYY
jgi:hypothetical protein